LEVIATAIHLLHFYSGSSVCLVTVWIIFARTLNVDIISVIIQLLGSAVIT